MIIGVGESQLKKLSQSALRGKVEHFDDDAALPLLSRSAEKCLVHRFGNVFFATIVTDLCRYFFEDDSCLAAFQDNRGVSLCGEEPRAEASGLQKPFSVGCAINKTAF